MSKSHALASFALLAAFFAAPVQAGDVALTSNGQWYEFDVSSDLAQNFGVGWIDMNDAYAPLTFTFSIGAGSAGLLTVVDAGFAGDTYRINNNGNPIGFGATSAVARVAYDPNATAIADFDVALANPAFSQGAFAVGAGTYRISGLLDQSVTLDGSPLNSTFGGIRLTTTTTPVTPIPEPSTVALMLAGFGFVALFSRRRGR